MGIVTPLNCLVALPVDEDEDGTDHPAAAELRARIHRQRPRPGRCCGGGQHRTLRDSLAERLADRFSNPVGHTVGMTEAFALDKFIPLFFKGNLVQCFNMDISLH